MSQILDPVPVDGSATPLLCCYVNATSKIQVARITNVSNWYFERVVFPGQRLLFEAVPGSQLEIHTGMMASAILSDRIACEQLVVQEQHPEPSLVGLEGGSGSTPTATLTTPYDVATAGLMVAK
ncbi:DUF1830 domain-containing protein [Prochlorothrix hollandica]|uniref:DUF1830 domain-containing protein n=1 Tax=Prochlorothrix hollandica PCC 9006 = CALU 1027 TaxID=317619 RepID=A0A0M2PPD7_PROHO|nr:DUF1830 domain-containing protein [Prochlorothrix hollandica]KKI98440.1 hypothetical protein PROH_18460 [Prochlorothrix hollandica PCC 9006 = CALU 1027]